MKVTDPDEESIPAMVKYLQQILPAVNGKRFISKKNLEDLVNEWGPPSWLLVKSRKIQRRIITKAMCRMGNSLYSAHAWMLEAIA